MNIQLLETYIIFSLILLYKLLLLGIAVFLVFTYGWRKGLKRRKLKVISAENIIVAGILLAIILLITLNLDMANLDPHITTFFREAQESFPLFLGYQTPSGHYGPILLYILKPFLLVYNSYYTIFFCLILSYVAASLLLYKFGKDFFGKDAGFIAMLLYGFSYYLSGIISLPWPQHFIPPFAMLFVYSIYKIKFEGDTLYYMLLFVSLGVLLQLHLIAFPLLPLLFVFFALKPKISWRYIFLGLVLFLVIFFPYIYYEVSNGFSETRERFSFALRFIGGTNPGDGAPPSLLEAATNPLEEYFFRIAFVFMPDWRPSHLWAVPAVFGFILLFSIVPVLHSRMLLLKNVLLLTPLICSLIFLKLFVYPLHPPRLVVVFLFSVIIIASILGNALFVIRRWFPILLGRIIIYTLIILVIAYALHFFVDHISYINDSNMDLPIGAKISIVSTLTKQEVYGDLYAYNDGMNNEHESLMPMISFYKHIPYTADYSYKNDMVTFIALNNTWSFGEPVNSIPNSRAKWRNKEYIISTVRSLAASEWKYSQIEEPGWFNPEFSDKNWRLTSMPMILCVDKAVYPRLPCNGDADYNDFYLRGIFNIKDCGNNSLALISHERTQSYELEGLYINGNKVESQLDRRLGIEVSKYCKPGENLIAVHLNTNNLPTMPPPTTLYYFFMFEYVLPRNE